LPSTLRLSLLALALFCGVPATASAGGHSREQLPCPWWRPCGPGNTYGGNQRVPQGAFGVDARPACEKHDQCYREANGRRKDCDRAFLKDLRCECEHSTHPWLCRRVAKLAYIGVRVMGRSSYGTP
jgi:hypothetical protein